MTIEERIAIIDTLLPILYEYKATGKARGDVDKTEALRSVYGDIFGIYNINANCPSCILNYLEMLQAYKDSVMGQITPPQAITDAPVKDNLKPEEVIEKVKTSKKPKNCCKKK